MGHGWATWKNTNELPIRDIFSRAPALDEHLQTLRDGDEDGDETFDHIQSCGVFLSSGWSTNTAKRKVCKIPNTSPYCLVIFQVA